VSRDPYAEILGPVAARESLDVGCGTGAFTRQLAASLGSWGSILGIDPDKDSVDEARRLSDFRGSRPRVRFRVMSALEMPFPDDRFDLVSVSNTLHHLDDPSAVLREMARVAKPGGWFVVQELVSDALTPPEANERDVHHLKARIDRLNGRVHRPTGTRAQVREILAGLAPGIREEAATEVVDEDPGLPGSERAQEVIGFLGDYLEFVRDEPTFDEFRREAARISASILRHGIATPPRLLVRLRLADRPDAGARRASPATRGEGHLHG